MRRIFTLAVGIGLGAAAAFLIARGLRRARQRVPQAIADGARSRITSLRELIEDVAKEGRRAMNEKEAELRQGGPPAEV